MSTSDHLMLRLWQRLKPFHNAILVYLLVITVLEIVQIVGRYQISLAISLIDHDLTSLHWVLLVLAAILYRVLFITLDMKADWSIIRLLYSIERYLNIESLKKFLDMRVAWHTQNNSGALVGKVSHGTDKTIDMVAGYAWEFIPTILQTILSTIPLVFISWQIAVIVYIVLVLFLFLTVKSYKAREPSRQTRHDHYETSWHLKEETVLSIRTINVFNQKDQITTKFTHLFDDILNLGMKETRLAINRYGPLRHLLISSSDLTILFFLLFQAQTGAISASTMVFCWTLVQTLLISFWRFGRLIERTAEASEGFSRLDSLLDEPTEVYFAQTPSTLVNPPIEINFDQIEFAYNGNSDHTLKGFSLTVPANTTVALVGPSGAGKSTVINLLNGFWKTSNGQITLNGINIYDLTEEQLHSLISLVPQGDSIDIFDDTILNNLRFGKPNASLEEVIKVTQLANLHHDILAMKDGYHTIVGERGVRLSGGQKQRLAIARTLLFDPPVLVFDEPTSFLDLGNEHEIKEAIAQSRQNRTTIIIAHRLFTVRDADLIAVLDQGQVVELGDHHTLLKQNGLYASLHHLDQSSLLTAAV